MVPGNFGCGSAVLAAITTLPPSLAAFNAIAFLIPLLAPENGAAGEFPFRRHHKLGD
jgi:hypothetical protein